jgi:hypothetical protein
MCLLSPGNLHDFARSASRFFTSRIERKKSYLPDRNNRLNRSSPEDDDIGAAEFLL